MKRVPDKTPNILFYNNEKSYVRCVGHGGLSPGYLAHNDTTNVW